MFDLLTFCKQAYFFYFPIDILLDMWYHIIKIRVGDKPIPHLINILEDKIMYKISINGAIMLADNTMQPLTGVYERDNKIEGSHEQIVSTVTGLDVKTFWGSVTQVAVTYTLDWTKVRELLGEQVKQLVDSLPNSQEFYKTSSGNTSVTNGSKGGSYADRAKAGYYDSYKTNEDGSITFGKVGQYPNTTTAYTVHRAITNGSVQKPALIAAIKERFGVADNGEVI